MIAPSSGICKRRCVTSLCIACREVPFRRASSLKLRVGSPIFSSIKANDRATLLNLMVGLNGYTLCSGILCDNLNGSDYWAVKLKSDEVMTIGYLKRKGIALSPLGQKYLEEIRKFEGM